MGRFVLAVRSFLAILLRGELPVDIAATLGLGVGPSPAPPLPEEPVRTSDGAVQMLAILQRDARLVDFLMEDISQYPDEQVGAAVRSLHEHCRDALSRYVHLVPVMDAVEGSFTRLEAAPSGSIEASRVKLLGNVPAQGIPKGGLLRHKGWRADRVDLPRLDPRHDHSIVAPAELEIE